MKQIIAMHGWSGDSQTWIPWQEYFKQYGWNWQSGERGYGNLSPINPKWRKGTGSLKENRRVIISHSLGLHLIATKVLVEATDLVLIASFGRFLPKGYQGKALEAGIKRMQELLGTKDELKMLNTFQSKVFNPKPVPSLTLGPIKNGLSTEGRKKLEEDLELLIQTKGIPSGIPEKARVLVIEGSKDNIVADASKKLLLEDLRKNLTTPPSNWIYKKEGHAMNKPELIQEVHQWLQEIT